MPIPALAAAALISAIPSVAQGITGFFQGNKSRKMLDGLERPEYTIPETATQALGGARVNAGSQYMAGQTNLEQGQDQILSNATSDILGMSTSGPEALAALIGAYGGRQSAQNEIGFSAAQDYNSRQLQLQNALNTYAGYEDKAWELNEFQPYQDKAAAASALGNAGMRNKYEALKTLSGIGAQYAAMGAFDPKVTTTTGGPAGGASFMGEGATSGIEEVLKSLSEGVASSNTSVIPAAAASNYVTPFGGQRIATGGDKNPQNWDVIQSLISGSNGMDMNEIMEIINSMKTAE